MAVISVQDRVLRIKIFDEIHDWWGISAQQISNGIDYYRGEFDSVAVFINSPGGSVTDGIAIRNEIIRLEESGIPVEKEITGLAASISSIIVLSPNNPPKMRDGTYLMIHRPFVFAGGDHEDLQSWADTMKKMNDDIANIYVDCSDLEADVVQDYMKKETWFTAEEAEGFNFAKRIPSQSPVNVLNSSSFMNKSTIMNKFENVPETILNGIKSLPNTGGSSDPSNKGVSMGKELDDLLAKNPEAKKQHELALAAALGTGKAQGSEEEPPAGGDGGDADPSNSSQGEPAAKTDLKTVAKTVATSDEYGSVVKNCAINFLSGEGSAVSFESALAAADSAKEEFKSLKAQNLANPDTPPTPNDKGDGDGDGDGDGSTKRVNVKNFLEKRRKQVKGDN